MRKVPTTSYNEPSPHAQSLMRTYGKQTASWGAASIAVIAVGLYVAPSLWLLWALLAVCGFAVASGMYKKYGQARIGYVSEAKIAKTLQRSNSAQVLINSCMLGAGGDADHVLLGPCAVVVETKTGFGKLNVRKGRVYSGNRQVGKDEISQVRRQARALESLIKVPVRAIVCVADASGPVQTVGDVTVCSGKDLPSVVKTSPSVIDVRNLGQVTTRVLNAHAKHEKKSDTGR